MLLRFIELKNQENSTKFPLRSLKNMLIQHSQILREVCKTIKNILHLLKMFAGRAGFPFSRRVHHHQQQQQQHQQQVGAWCLGFVGSAGFRSWHVCGGGMSVFLMISIVPHRFWPRRAVVGCRFSEWFQLSPIDFGPAGRRWDVGFFNDFNCPP